MIIRQSHIVLIFRLIGVEILLAFIYLIVRIPKTVFFIFFIGCLFQFVFELYRSWIFYGVISDRARNCSKGNLGLG